MIYDCFKFFNELELLEIRLNELDDFVDRFVIVESTVTTQNTPKELFFEKHKQDFKRWADRIIQVIVTDSPNTSESRVVEAFQSNAVCRGLPDVRSDDLILWSDADEIPNKTTVRHWRNKLDRPTVLLQWPISGFLNCRELDRESDWAGSRMIRGDIWNNVADPFAAFRIWLPDQVPNGGWHFTSQGGPERMRMKWRSFGHREYNSPRFLEGNFAEEYLESRRLGREGDLRFEVMPWEMLPPYIYQHRERFKYLLLPCSQPNPSSNQPNPSLTG